MTHAEPLNAGDLASPAPPPARRRFWTADRCYGLLRLLSIVLFLGTWEVASYVNLHVHRFFNPLLLPSLGLVLQAGVELVRSGELFVHIWASLARVVQGFVAASVVGVALGTLAGRSRVAEALIEPVVSMMRPVPPLAFLPMLVLWFGIGELSKIMFIAYATFFPVFTTTVEGIKYIDPVLMRAAASLGASQRDQFKYVVLPAALPSILTGLRIGFGLSCFVIVAAEFIAANAGLGFLINDGRTFFQVPQMLLGAATVGLIGFTFNAGLKALERHLLKWRRDART